MAEKVGSVLVLGGGIAGIQASLDLVQQGYKVYLVEQKPSIGGVMAQLDKTFPTNDCAMCILAPKLVDTGRHPNIEIITNADIEKVTGEPGNFVVTVNKKPRFVNEDDCTGCGTCWDNCPVKNKPQIPEEKEIEVLKDNVLEEINKIMEVYKDKKGSIVPVLQDVNLLYRYLPTDVLKHIAQKLGIPLSQVYNIATFYNAFSLVPKGKQTIHVCLGTACYVKGGRKILEAFERNLKIKAGGTTDDLNFSLELVNCVGCCGQAPVVTVGDDIYGYMKQSMISKVHEKYMKQGGTHGEDKT